MHSTAKGKQVLYVILSFVVTHWLLTLIRYLPLDILLSFYISFRVISGAPEDENQYQYMAGVEKAGAVYRCQTDLPHHCEQIPFDTSGKHFNFGISFAYSYAFLFSITSQGGNILNEY